MSFTTRNHYVPQWYQHLFFPAGLREKKFFYLDLHPEKCPLPGGRYFYRSACRRLGPINCFMQDHLYGRPPRDNDPQVEKLREEEWITHQKAIQAWDQKLGPLTSDEMVRYF